MAAGAKVLTDMKEVPEAPTTTEVATRDALLTEERILRFVDTASMSKTRDSGSLGLGSFIPSTEDLEETKSEDLAPSVEAGPAAAAMVEDDAWYRTILDFIRQEAEGNVGAHPNFARAHIPSNEVQVPRLRRDASRAELATATLAARGR